MSYKLTWHGKAVQKAMRKEVMKHVLKCAADLAGKSKREAPIDVGDLRDNCNVSYLKEDGSKLWYEVGYDLPYAIIQHERLDFNHPKGGKAKYLEDPFNANKKQYAEYIKEKTLKALERER